MKKTVFFYFFYALFFIDKVHCAFYNFTDSYKSSYISHGDELKSIERDGKIKGWQLCKRDNAHESILLIARQDEGCDALFIEPKGEKFCACILSTVGRLTYLTCDASSSERKNIVFTSRVYTIPDKFFILMNKEMREHLEQRLGDRKNIYISILTAICYHLACNKVELNNLALEVLMSLGLPYEECSLFIAANDKLSDLKQFPSNNPNVISNEKEFVELFKEEYREYVSLTKKIGEEEEKQEVESPITMKENKEENQAKGDTHSEDGEREEAPVDAPSREKQKQCLVQ